MYATLRPLLSPSPTDIPIQDCTYTLSCVPWWNVENSAEDTSTLGDGGAIKQRELESLTDLVIGYPPTKNNTLNFI